MEASDAEEPAARVAGIDIAPASNTTNAVTHRKVGAANRNFIMISLLLIYLL
jgi:hypothetical protein